MSPGNHPGAYQINQPQKLIMAKVLKKRGPKIVDWPDEKVKQLRKLYPNNPTEVVAAALGVTERAVRSAAIRFKVKKSGRYWDKPEEDYVLKNWDQMSADEIAEGIKAKFKVEKTRWAVINKYRELKGFRNK